VRATSPMTPKPVDGAPVRIARLMKHGMPSNAEGNCRQEVLRSRVHAEDQTATAGRVPRSLGLLHGPTAFTMSRLPQAPNRWKRGRLHAWPVSQYSAETPL
jgi:hypothetical protein